MSARIERVLVPVDFSPCSEAALQYAIFVASCLDASVDVLHVWEPPARVEPWLPEEVDRVVAASQHDVRNEIERWVGPHRQEKQPLHTKIVVDRPLQGILREANQGHYDLVVLGTHGRTGIARVLLGSVAEAVLRRSPCPVVTVRAPHPGAASAA